MRSRVVPVQLLWLKTYIVIYSMNGDISKYLDMIPDHFETITLDCKNSYQRFCIYRAIEEYQQRHPEIKITKNRVHSWVLIDRLRCKKHWLPGYGGCGCCSDPYCTGPKCSRGCNSPCEFVDPAYNCKTKVIVGIKLVYHKI